MSTNMLSPQNDYYAYVNQQWLDANPIPNDYTRWGSFEVLIEETNKKVKQLLDTPDDGSDANWSKVATLWSQGNDERTLNETNVAQSIGDLMNKINNVSTVREMTVVMATLYMSGITSAIDFGANSDLKNSQLNILWIDRNNLGLPDRDYYFNEKMAEKVKYYKDFLVESLNYVKNKFGFDFDPDEMAKNVFDLESKLADSMLTMTERRDPAKIYNPTNLTELKTTYQNIDWDNMFNTIGVNVGDNMICDQEPKFLTTLNKLLVEIDLHIWKYYSMLKVIWSVSQFLDDEVSNMCFNFYGTKLNGQTIQKPRWKRVMSISDSLVGELVGKKYCSLYFTQESKDATLEMIKNMLKMFEQRINNLSWMSDTTKEKAKEKLHKLGVKIGFPDKWENFDDLNVTNSNTYCQNVMECFRLKTKKNLDMCYLQVDKQKWHMFPHQINAYYDPTQNEIVFPAGILQAPFFDKDQPVPTNYGGIGAVISHECGHAFDDSGSQFDANGNLNNWWTDEDKTNYKQATQKMIEQFNSYTMEGMNLNGQLCLGEDIADYCGVTVALNSLIIYLTEHNLNVKEGMDLFFKSYATIWRNNIRPDALKNRLVTDPHAPGYYRVNGILPNIPQFYELYNVTENDGMYLEPSKRTLLW